MSDIGRGLKRINDVNVIIRRGFARINAELHPIIHLIS